MCNSLGIQLSDMLSDAPFTSAVLPESTANCLSSCLELFGNATHAQLHNG